MAEIQRMEPTTSKKSNNMIETKHTFNFTLDNIRKLVEEEIRRRLKIPDTWNLDLTWKDLEEGPAPEDVVIDVTVTVPW